MRLGPTPAIAWLSRCAIHAAARIPHLPSVVHRARESFEQLALWTHNFLTPFPVQYGRKSAETISCSADTHTFRGALVVFQVLKLRS
jgi:hypothetical protein